MNDTATFYDEHWSIKGAYDGPEAAAFQLKLFREMFPGFEEKVPKQVKSGDIVLDIGCGNGIAAATYFGHTLDRAAYYGVDASWVGIDQAKERIGELTSDATFILANYLDGLTFSQPFASTIFCPGVLHYAPDLRKAVEALTPFLKLGGRFITWIYKEPPPVRKITDALLSGVISKLPPKEARTVVEGLTQLGLEIGVLSENSALRINLTDPVPVLGIKPGEYTLHEFFYYYIMKLFYNPSLSFERHLVNNLNAFGHEHVLHLPESEILAILVELGYDLELWNPRGNGVAIIAVRTGLSEQDAARSCY